MVPEHRGWENPSSGEERRSIGGRFFENGESEASWVAWFSDSEGNRVLKWNFEVVVETEEMDKVGEGGRVLS